MLRNLLTRTVSVYTGRLCLFSIVYYIVLKLSLAFSVSPELVIPVAPAVAIAVAFMVVWGIALWPGVWVISAVVYSDLNLLWPSNGTLLTNIILANIIGLAASLQAIIGGWFVNKYLSLPVRLEKLKDIALLLAVIIPLICLIPATFVTTALLIVTNVEALQYIFKWLTWWVGESIGTMLLLPPLLLIFGSKKIRYSERGVTAAVLSLLVCVLVAIFLHSSLHTSKANMKTIFKRHSSEQFQLIKEQIIYAKKSMYSVKALLEISDDVSESEFINFTSYIKDQYKGVRAIQWAPLVINRNRAVFEKALTLRLGQTRPISQDGAVGGITIAKEKAVYYPIEYSNPKSDYRNVLGYDLLSNSIIADAIEKATHTKLQFSTERIYWQYLDSRVPAYLVATPVFFPNGTLKGVVTGVFEVGGFITDALEFSDPFQSISIWIEDTLALGTARRLYGSIPDTNPAFMWNAPFEAPGQMWRFHFYPESKYLSINLLWNTWQALLLGLVCSLFASILILLITGRTAVIKRLVSQKTKEVVEARQKLQLLLDYAGEGIFGVDKKGEVIFANHAATELLGYDIATVENAKLVDYIRPHTDKKVSTNQMKQAVQKGKILRCNDEWFTNKKGVSVPVEYYCNPFYSKDKKLAGSVIIFRNISERLKADKKLKESKQRFALAVDATQDGIWDWPNVDRDAQYWSPQFKRLLGYNAPELNPSFSNFKKMVCKDDLSYVQEYMQSLFRKGDSFDLECRLKHKKGHFLWFQVRGLASQGKDQKVLRVTGSISDISARKLAQENLQRVNNELKSFTYIVSHDLRSPLINLQGFTTKLVNYIDQITPLAKEGVHKKAKTEQDKLTEVLNNIIPKTITFIQDSVSRIDAMTNAVLQLSRTGSREFKFRKIKTKSLLEACVNVVSYQLDQKNITIKIGKVPNIVGDPIALEQVFSNLLDNAVKYMQIGKEGEIRITGKSRADLFEFAISDNGRGVAKDEQDNIFAVFKRASNVEDIAGEGMGLAYVKTIVEQHGGRIWLESKLGAGSTFYFTLKKNLK